MKQIFKLDQIDSLNIPLDKPSIIFLKGDLGAGKTTLSQSLLKKLVGEGQDFTSPTYTYYNKYGDNYHFDLYRLQNYDEFFAIGGEEILDNNTGIILIEWPELIEDYYTPNIKITLEKTENENERLITIKNSNP